MVALCRDAIMVADQIGALSCFNRYGWHGCGKCGGCFCGN